MNNKNKSSFTLIEVLYSIAIMGILFAIALPGIKKLTYNQDKFDLKEYASNIARFQIKNFPKFNNYQIVNLQKVKNNYVTTNKNMKIFLPNGFYIKTQPLTCDDKSIGLYLYLKNPKLNAKDDEIELNTCNSFNYIRK